MRKTFKFTVHASYSAKKGEQLSVEGIVDLKRQIVQQVKDFKFIGDSAKSEIAQFTDVRSHVVETI